MEIPWVRTPGSEIPLVLPHKESPNYWLQNERRPPWVRIFLNLRRAPKPLKPIDIIDTNSKISKASSPDEAVDRVRQGQKICDNARRSEVEENFSANTLALNPLAPRFRRRSWRPTHFPTATSDLRLTDIRNSLGATNTVRPLSLPLTLRIVGAGR